MAAGHEAGDGHGSVHRDRHRWRRVDRHAVAIRIDVDSGRSNRDADTGRNAAHRERLGNGIAQHDPHRAGVPAGDRAVVGDAAEFYLVGTGVHLRDDDGLVQPQRLAGNAIDPQGVPVHIEIAARSRDRHPQGTLDRDVEG